MKEKAQQESDKNVLYKRFAYGPKMLECRMGGNFYYTISLRPPPLPLSSSLSVIRTGRNIFAREEDRSRNAILSDTEEGGREGGRKASFLSTPSSPFFPTPFLRMGMRVCVSSPPPFHGPPPLQAIWDKKAT